MDEPGLVAIHKRSNVRSDAVCHHFGEELHGTVLKGNRAESIGGVCSFFFWQEHKMGTVESIKVQRAIMEGSKEVEDCRLDLGPEGAVERGTKPIRPRT